MTGSRGVIRGSLFPLTERENLPNDPTPVLLFQDVFGIINSV